MFPGLCSDCTYSFISTRTADFGVGGGTKYLISGIPSFSPSERLYMKCTAPSFKIVLSSSSSHHINWVHFHERIIASRKLGGGRVSVHFNFTLYCLALPNQTLAASERYLICMSLHCLPSS